jgi:hypothetical protein
MGWDEGLIRLAIDVTLVAVGVWVGWDGMRAQLG